MIKSFEKLKVRIDQNLNRGEKSEALTEDVVKIKNKVTCLKQVCETVTKKLSDGVTSSSSSSSNVKGNDGAAVEKRIRKTAEFGLGQTFQENGRSYVQHEKNAESVSKFLVEGGSMLNDLATDQVTYELKVEKLVLNPLNTILQDHGPQIEKEEKRNKQNSTEFDTATALLANHRTKLDNITGNTTNYAEGLEREEELSNKLAEMETRLNHSRESVELLMLQFLSKESDVGQLLLKYFELKRDYHASVAERISQEINAFEDSLSAAAAAPIFGCDLESHIKRNSSLTRSRLAFPLRLCVVRLLQLDGLQEDGIFRVSAPATKIKRLAALIDAGECNDEDASYANDIFDVHVFSGTLKLYLRELPHPLMCSTPDMYREWMSACGCSTTDRRGAIKALIYTLPDDNFRNLHYLFAFLNHVSKFSHQNKMTTSNLSIVMAPNLLCPSSDPDEGTNQSNPPKLDFAESNLVNDIVESLIANVEYYFGEGDVDFFQDPPTLIGSKKLTLRGGSILNSTIVGAGKSAGSLTVRESLSGDTSWINTSGSVHTHNSTTSTGTSKNVQDSTVKLNQSPSTTTGNSNTPKHQYPPVPAQRTPVPKPRGSKSSGYGKAYPPPRPTERPRNLVDETSLSNNSNNQSPEKSGKSITKL